MVRGKWRWSRGRIGPVWVQNYRDIMVSSVARSGVLHNDMGWKRSGYLELEAGSHECLCAGNLSIVVNGEF
jgi:hypothetical protein